MSKKDLLSEATVRQFMKYANIEGLTDNFINETYSATLEEEEVVAESDEVVAEGDEVVAEGDYGMEEEMHDDAMEEPADEPVLDDLDADDAPAEDALPAEAVSALEQAVEAAADAMLAALAPYGVEGEATIEDEPEAELPGDEGPEAVEDDEIPGLDVLDEEAIVNETMNRVTRRLAEMKDQQARDQKRDQMIDSLADSIMQRLQKK
tara:strand:+ start:3167 stop:3787 length:621 start_codon:yes stop_codon:yes gene_type:complete